MNTIMTPGRKYMPCVRRNADAAAHDGISCPVTLRNGRSRKFAGDKNTRPAEENNQMNLHARGHNGPLSWHYSFFVVCARASGIARFQRENARRRRLEAREKEPPSDESGATYAPLSSRQRGPLEPHGMTPLQRQR
ncbi:hypothetical protein MRX96_038006 [Rhipicephalus microplus]